jgi:hypothetical protein
MVVEAGMVVLLWKLTLLDDVCCVEVDDFEGRDIVWRKKTGPGANE